jgi:hypothetical protein
MLFPTILRTNTLKLKIRMGGKKNKAPPEKTNFGGEKQGKHRLICFTNAPREGLVFLKLCRRITKSPVALHNENRTEKTLRFSLFRVREGVDWEVRKTKPLPR